MIDPSGPRPVCPFGIFDDPRRIPTQAEIEFYATARMLREQEQHGPPHSAKNAEREVRVSHHDLTPLRSSSNETWTAYRSSSDSALQKILPWHPLKLPNPLKRKTAKTAQETPPTQGPDPHIDHRKTVLRSLGYSELQPPPVFEANRHEARATAAAAAAPPDTVQSVANAELKRGIGFRLPPHLPAPSSAVRQVLEGPPQQRCGISTKTRSASSTSSPTAHATEKPRQPVPSPANFQAHEERPTNILILPSLVSRNSPSSSSPCTILKDGVGSSTALPSMKRTSVSSTPPPPPARRVRERP